jgi:hypothetical protein
MRYINTIPKNFLENHNECTIDERERIERAVIKTLHIIQNSFKNYHEPTFRRWFGADNPEQPDINVKQRIRNAYDFMKGGYDGDAHHSQNRWNVVCCKN